MACLTQPCYPHPIDYSQLFSCFSQFFVPVHTWATSMQTDVTRKPQPILRSELLKRHVSNLRLTKSPRSRGYDAKRWLQNVPGQLERKE